MICLVLFTHDLSARGKRRAKLEGCGWGLFAASARPLGAELRTWRARLPQELRLARIGALELANALLNKRYVAEFNDKFAVPAKEKGTAFRRTSRRDLNWVFTVQTERVVAKDNTVKIGNQNWQLEKSRFRHSLTGSTVTIQELSHRHNDETCSLEVP